MTTSDQPGPAPQPPATPTSSPVAPSATTREPWRPLAGKERTILTLTIIMTVFLVLTAIGNIYFHSELGAMINEGIEDQDRFETGFGAYILPLALFVMLYVATFIVTIVWFRAAYRNVRALGVNTGRRLGWAVWAWLIPIVNLVLPRIMAGEIFTAIKTNAEKTGRRITTTIVLLNWWWGIWILAFFLPNFVNTGQEDLSYAEIRSGAGFDRFYLVAVGIEIWLTWLVVKRMSNDLEAWRTSTVVDGEPASRADAVTGGY